MIRGTTPTLTLRIKNAKPELDLTQATSVYVTIRQNGRTITKTGEDVSVAAKAVACWLTQAESLSLRDDSEAEVQINWTYGEGKRGATKPKMIPIIRQTYPEVL